MAASSLKNYRYIFVLTYGRSGSTILMRLLNTVDGAEIRGENSNALFHLYKSIAAVRRSSTRFGLVARESNDPWFGANLIAAKSFENACLGAFLDDVLAPDPETTIVGFKEINHLPNRMRDKEFYGYVDFIMKTFPKSRIVFNTREAGQVARSGWFADMDTDYVKEQIEAADIRFAAATKRHRRCRMIDYSDVIKNGEKLAGLFDWLGVHLDRDVIATCLDRKLSHMDKKETGIVGSLREGMRGVRSKLKITR